LDHSELAILTFKVSKKFPFIPENSREALPILAPFPILDEQGDGFRSFVGVVLSILLCKDRVILLDEPEAFLHPAQARILGGWIGRKSKELDGQIIVATHNSNFLAGILSSNANVNILRLNRIDDNTSFHKISSDSISNIVKSPLLSSQPVLESIFHRGVAVCEGDSDRVIYQTVALKQFQNEEILFIHAHSKQAIRNVINLIKPSGIPVCAIVDLDILNTEKEFKDLVSALCNQVNIFVTSRNNIAQRVTLNKTDKDLINGLIADLNEFSQELNENYPLNLARTKMNNIHRGLNRWKDVKDKGLEGIQVEPRNEATILINDLMSLGLFVVPVGELENWIPTGVSQKNLWTIEALKKLYNDECPPNLREFVNEIIQYLNG
jgi:hypothetical protein